MFLVSKGTPKFQDQETVEEEEEFRQQNRGESNPMPQSMKEELDSLAPTKSDDDDDTLSYFAALAAD